MSLLLTAKVVAFFLFFVFVFFLFVCFFKAHFFAKGECNALVSFYIEIRPLLLK